MKLLLAITAAGALMSGSAKASLYQFDENGNASGAGSSYQLAADSSTGITTLDYLVHLDGGLFFALSQGWVAIYADPAQTQLSDLVHFGSILTIGPGNHGDNLYQQVFYYSHDDSGTLADNWLTTLQIDTLFTGSSLAKISENPAGVATYIPATGQPGFLNGGVPPDLANSYNFVSSVPEPGAYGAFAGALGLFCFGGGRVGRWWRRRCVFRIGL